MRCMWKSGHTLQNCKLLNDVAFLKRNFTNQQIDVARNNEMQAETTMNQLINQIKQCQLNAKGVEENNDKGMAFKDDSAEVTDSQDLDVCQGELQKHGIETQS